MNSAKSSAHFGSHFAPFSVLSMIGPFPAMGVGQNRPVCLCLVSIMSLIGEENNNRVDLKSNSFDSMAGLSF